MDLATPLTYVKGVGPARAAMLEDSPADFSQSECT